MSDPEQDRLVEALKSDPGHERLESPDRVMLLYAAKLTARPWEITAEDTRALGEAGFDSRAVHDICAITAYYAFVNRIADGLGVELEGEPG